MNHIVAQQWGKSKDSEFQWDDILAQIALATAEYLAQQVARRRRMSSADLEDLRQDILLALVRRARGYTAVRGAWSTYVKLVAQHAVADLEHSRGRVPVVGSVADPVLDIADLRDLRHDLVLRLDLARTLAALPTHLVEIIALIAEQGSVAAAQHASTIPSCVFYRRIADLRMWLRAAGLAPLVRKIRVSAGK